MALRDILIKIGGDTSHYEKSMRDLQFTTRKATQMVTSAWSIAAGAITMVSAGALVGFIKSSISAADAIAKTADRVGVSTGALQEYRYAASISGIETEKMDTSLEKFTRTLGETRHGTGALTSFLKKYDEQLLSNVKSSKSTDEALNLIFDAMGKTASEADRAALAAAAFGRAGVDMTSMVQDGAEGLNKMRQEARDLGIVIDERLIRNAEIANDRFDTLGWVIKNKAIAALLEFTPEIIKVTESLIDVARWSNEAASNIGIFFGLGKENKLRSELLFATEQLEKMERFQKAYESGSWWDKLITGNQDVSKQIEFWKKRQANVNKQLQDLTQPKTGAPGLKPGSTWEAPAEEKEKDPKKGVESALEEYFDFLDERQKRMKDIYDENLKIEQNTAKVRLEIATDVTDKINALTMDELEYKKWCLDEEVRALKEKAGDDKELLKQIQQYHKLALDKMTVNTKKSFGEDMKEAVTGWASNLSSELNDALWESEFTFDSMAKAFGKMITQMMIEKQVIEPFMQNSGDWWEKAGNWIGNYFSGGGGAGGGGSSMDSETVWAAHGDVFNGAGISRYKNRIISRPTVFPLARGGAIGLMGERGMEAVLPLTRTSSGNLGVEAKTGGGNNSYQIIDMRGAGFLDQQQLARTMDTIAAKRVEGSTIKVIRDDYAADGWVRQVLGR